jgi:phosphatidylglycerol:prolipoprotein diacylglycerol transferase
MFAIPYFQFVSVTIGPFTLYVWGFFVALGMLTSFFIIHHLLRHNKNLQESAERLFFWVVIAGIIGSRLGHVFLYEWPYFSTHPGDILKVWQGGLSSFGGFVGAALPLIIFWKKNNPATVQKIIATCTLAFPWGWGIGRIGCFMIHDHPGRPCPLCLLPIRYEDGSLRPDLGLYDALLALGVGLLLYISKKKNILKEEHLFPTLILAYSFPRFFLDFLRAYPPLGEVRYLGLTPAQYLSVFFCICAARAILKKRS